MSTATNGILTKANVNAMGPIQTWSSGTTECITFGDIYSSTLLNVRMNDASISTDRKKLVRNDKIVKHFVKQNGKVTINFKNKKTSGDINLGNFKLTVTLPNSITIKQNTDWANTTATTLTYTYPTALSISKTIRDWSGGGSSFGSLSPNTNVQVYETLNAWFVSSPNTAAGPYSIVLDNVTWAGTIYVGSTAMTRTTGTTSGTYKYTYSVNNSLMIAMYNNFKNQSLTVNIGVAGAYS